MKSFNSAFAPKLEALLAFREAMGLSRLPMAQYLRRLDRFCSAHYPNSAHLSKDIVMKWIDAESMRKNNDICGKANAIRQLGKYLDSVGEAAYILPERFAPRKSNFVPYIFSDDELASFFRSADALWPTGNYPFDPEIAPVLFRMLYSCGLRPGEGRLLKRSAINFNTGEVLITQNNKQKKERIIVMSDDMLALCKQYDTQRTIFGRGSDFFFPAREGRPYTPLRLIDVFKKCWFLANPDVPIPDVPGARPYDLRHRFATTVMHRWLDEGRDLYAMLPCLRAYMGHETFASTAYYIHLLPENLVRSAGIDWTSFDTMFPERVRQ